MSLEERMLEKERLAKAAGKASEYALSTLTNGAIEASMVMDHFRMAGDGDWMNHLSFCVRGISYVFDWLIHVLFALFIIELTREEVKEEIDQWTREFEEKWADKKLVKLERKKYHVWIHERIEDVEAQLKDVSNRRFPKLVDELLTMNFFTTKEIRHMCASLEETIVLRFELGWKVSVLNGEKPEKPPRRKKTDGHDTRRKEKMKVTEANDEV
ncbi:hypothetical protein BC938DRAFT_474660 [Jimgerdemannia flammicorona]|uniref:DUF7607 domain-containing protein n=1 Tax=Jimgerdemannia flammicorona TaxID=994334 RepID=A0A433Q264_9FUNG|nr:hypothetical protein BC938DRAFT_474660 [Jimgerdemannia flammicorona]